MFNYIWFLLIRFYSKKENNLKIRVMYKINMFFASILFIVVLLTTLTSIVGGNINLNNIILKSLLCIMLTLIMIVDSYINFKNGKDFYEKTIRTSLLKIAIILYYIYVIHSCVLYVYETIYKVENNGATMMIMGAAVMLNSINNSIPKMKLNN